MEDGLGVGLHIDAELRAAKSRDLTRALDRHARMVNRGAMPSEFYGGLDGNQTIVIGGTTYQIMRASSKVPGGRIWEVRSIRLAMGQGPFTASQAGTAHAFASTSDENFTTAAWKDTCTISVNRPAFYGAGQFVMYPNERLIILLASGTSGQNYSFSASAMGFDAAPPEQIVASV